MRNLGRVAWFALMALLVACGTVPGLVEEGAGDRVIPGQYIVTLAQPSLSTLSVAEFEVVVSRVSGDHRATPGRPLRLINGFMATDLDADDVAALRADPRVAAVEPDQIITVESTQTNAVWNLDRIDQRLLPLDSRFNYGQSGAGVTAFIVDTGIRSTHIEFGGRVGPGFSVFDDGYGTEDCHGHGTHVAGTVGGRTYGVAKEAALIPVRVLNCSGSGSVSGVIGGLDWVAANYRGPAVVNMSLGGPASSAMDTAVRNLVARGVTVVVAAGNAGADACGYSPARVAEALTTGAIEGNDKVTFYSNIGSCVDLFAPGTAVRAATIGSDTSNGFMSGTSMAAPHVAGVAAMVLQANSAATPAQVMQAVLVSATADVLVGAGDGSPNLLLFADAAAAMVPPTEPPATPNPEPDPQPEPEPEPDPEPEPEPGPPCSGCDVFHETLARSGDERVFPSNTTNSYTTRTTSVHLAWLRGPVGADFDLYLERQNNGGRWVVVARSEGATATEEITYAGKSGTYRWRVMSKSGAGEFDLYLSLP